jgi:hypothetical protein
MMAKGLKTGGRRPGTLNRTTADFRLQINSFLQRNWRKVQRDFDRLEPKDKLLFLEKLLKYCTPALSSVDSSFGFEKLSDEDLEEIVNRLKQQQ